MLFFVVYRVAFFQLAAILELLFGLEYLLDKGAVVLAASGHVVVVVAASLPHLVVEQIVALFGVVLESILFDHEVVIGLRSAAAAATTAATKAAARAL